jgi:predicted DNA-binding transcriptional regulator
VCKAVARKVEKEKIEQRCFIKVETLKGSKPIDIHKDLVQVYSDLALSYPQVRRWAEKFKCGQKSIQNDPRGRPKNTALTPENIKKVQLLVEKDGRMTMEEIEEELGISHDSVFRILHKCLVLTKLFAQQIPKILTTEHKEKRVEICKKNLKIMNRNPEKFLSQVVTGDETQIHYNDPPSRQESREWRHRGSSAALNARRERTTKKIWPQFFGIVRVHSSWNTYHQILH